MEPDEMEGLVLTEAREEAEGEILDAGEKTDKLDYCASDPLACLFFKGGWYERVQERLGEYEKI